MLRLIPKFSTCLILALALVLLASARQYSTNVNIPTFRRNDAWMFIDRMHLYPGHMTVSSQVNFLVSSYKEGSTYELQLVAIPESVWQSALLAKCDNSKLDHDTLSKVKVSEIVYPVDLNKYQDYKSNFVSKLDVPTEQTYSFVLRDCRKKIINDGYGREAKIQITIDVRNNDRHIAAGEELYGWLLPLLIGSAATILYFLHKEKEEEGDNWIKVTLKVSLWVGLASIIFKYLGYLIYAHGSGVQHGVFDVFYLLLHATSDSIMMVLLMLLSFGWTVTFKNARDFDLYVPLAAMLGLVNIIMTMLNKISDGEHDKYHMYDTIPAYIMIGFRMVGLLVFLVGIIRSWTGLKKDQEQSKVRRYLSQMTVLGLVYLAFVPVGFVLIRYVGSRYKKEGMFFSVELVRFGMSYWLALLAGWKKSAYRSIIDQSFMQKGDKFF